MITKRIHYAAMVEEAIADAYIRQSSKAHLDTRAVFGNFDWLDLGDLASVLPTPSFAPVTYGEAMRRAVTCAELGDWPNVCYWLRTAQDTIPHFGMGNWDKAGRIMALIAHFSTF